MQERKTPFIKILEKINTPIFKAVDHNNYTREQSLKRNMNRAINAVQENIYHTGIIIPNPWQKLVIERNINGLSNYIEKLYDELNEQKIIDYVKNFKQTHIDLRFESDEMILFVNSYYATIIYDIVWADNISVSDVINITQGRVDKKNLEAKFKDMVHYLNGTIIPYLNSSDLFRTKISRLEEGVLAYKQKLYKASSMMFISATEGLVKSLGKFLIDKQNIDVSKIKRPLHSLDSFLENIPWKYDYSIDIGKYIFLTGNYIFDRDYGVENTKMIDLKTRLNFLKRQYKEDRNSILHGDDFAFGETMDLYINFAALNEVYETIKYYNKLYN